MPKTYSGVSTKTPRVIEVQVKVGNNLDLILLTAVIEYNITDAAGVMLATNRQKIDLLAKLGVGQRNAISTALKDQLTSALNEY